MTNAGVNAAPESPVTAQQVLGTPESTQKPLDVAQPVAPDSDKVSPKLQMLMKRERVAIEREKSAKAKEAEIEGKAKAFSEREARLQEFESLKSTNPKKALELLGLSYQELTEIILNDGNVTPDIQVKRVEDKFNSYVKTQEEALRRQEEEAKSINERRQLETISKFKGEIGSYLKEHSDRYELIEFEQSQDLVYEVVDEHYDRTWKAAQAKAEEEGLDPDSVVGEVLTIAQAADKVEQHLEQKYDKARNLNKVKAFLGQRPEKPVDTKQIQKSQPPRTLNNQLSATPSLPRKAPITDDERIARAIAYARGLRP